MNLKSKTNELEKVREELREMVGKRGAMLGLSHQDPTWSSAKANNWGLDIDKLQEKERSILDEITEIKHDPAFIKDLEAKNTYIVTKRTKLQADLAKLKVEVFEKRGERAQVLIDGGDPLKIASDLFAMQDRMEVITLAIENCNLAASILDKLGEDIPYQPAHAQDWPKGQKFEIPPAETPHVRVS